MLRDDCAKIELWMNTLKYNPKLWKKPTQQKIELLQYREEMNLYNFQWKRNLYCLISKAFHSRVTQQKTSTELKTKRNWTKHVVLNYIVNKTLPPSSLTQFSVSWSDGRLQSVAFDLRTQLWSFKDGFMSFHWSRLRTTFSYISQWQQHDFQVCGKYTNIWSWQGNKVLLRGFNSIVMSYREQQADLNWHHNTKSPMSLHWKASTRAQLQTTFF